MDELHLSRTAFIWRLKWWWMLPMGFIAVLFALLVLFSDASGDAPFIYQLF